MDDSSQPPQEPLDTHNPSSAQDIPETGDANDKPVAQELVSDAIQGSTEEEVLNREEGLDEVHWRVLIEELPVQENLAGSREKEGIMGGEGLRVDLLEDGGLPSVGISTPPTTGAHSTSRNNRMNDLLLYGRTSLLVYRLKSVTSVLRFMGWKEEVVGNDIVRVEAAVDRLYGELERRRDERGR
jgi:hypothetical protein